MSDKRDFDPRFDPAFQRGYVDGGASMPTPMPPAVVELPQRLENPPQAVDPRARPDATADEVLAHPEPAAVTLVGNPWVRALWIIAPVFIVGGLAGQAWSQTVSFGFNNGGSGVFVSYVIPSLVQSLGPWMVLVGLAALVGVVFLHAVRWRAEE